MSVDILVLGSSAAMPLPRTTTNRFEDYADTVGYVDRFALHTDPVCAAAKKGGRDRRTRASLALITDGQAILFDAGPDTPYHLATYEVRPVAACITHDHPDACAGVAGLPTEVAVYRETKGTVKHDVPFTVGPITITPFRVIHAKEVPSLGYRAVWRDGAGRERSIAYATDLSSVRGLKAPFTSSDVIFIDGSILDISMAAHLSIREQLSAYKRWEVKRVIVTHVGHRTGTHDALSAIVREVYDRAEVAYDGMRVVI